MSQIRMSREVMTLLKPMLSQNQRGGSHRSKGWSKGGHWGSFGVIWDHLGSFEVIWDHSGPFGTTWDPLWWMQPCGCSPVDAALCMQPCGSRADLWTFIVDAPLWMQPQ